MRKVPEKHGKCVNADHVVGVAVGEEELVGSYNSALAFYIVKPDIKRQKEVMLSK